MYGGGLSLGGIMSAEILLWDYCGIGEIVVGLGGGKRGNLTQTAVWIFGKACLGACKKFVRGRDISKVGELGGVKVGM